MAKKNKSKTSFKAVNKFPLPKDKYDGISKEYVTKDREIHDELVDNEEINNLMILANDSINQNEYDIAINYFDRVIREYNYYRAFNEKGYLLIKLGQFEKAFECFDESIKITKNNYLAHIGKSLVLSEFLKEDPLNFKLELELISNLDIACIINKEGFLIKSKILKELNQFDKSFSALTEYFENYKDLICNDEEKYIEVLSLKGELSFLLYRYSDAFFYFYKILKLDEKNIEALNAMGFIAPTLNKYDYALECFDKVFELTNSVSSLFYKAELLIGLHRYEEGIECFNRCPFELIPPEYKQLLKYAKEQVYLDNATEFFGLTRIDSNQYLYTYVHNGFRKIYGDYRNIVYKLREFDSYLIKINYAPEFATWEYVKYYYRFPNEEVEYKNLISSILNNKFLADFDKGKIDVEKLLYSKTNTEKKIIKYLINVIKNQLKYAKKSHPTGFYGVVPYQGSFHYRWSYVDLIKARHMGWIVINAETLDELEEIVRDQNLLWYVYNEELAEESRKSDDL